MKVESVSIDNFKLFKNKLVFFKNRTLEEISNRFLILGDNGSGKTTLLQAIALPLALATKSIQGISDFDWMGFLPGRYWKWGNPRIELEVSFENEEIEATCEIAQKWYDAQSDEYKKDRGGHIEPGKSRTLKLILTGDYWKVGEKNVDADRFQFLGRHYAKTLLRRGKCDRSVFSKLPGIFWFDQFRNLGSSLSLEKNGEGTKKQSGGISYEMGVGSLRRYLIDWEFRQKKGKSNYLMELENLYKKIFTGRSFSGLERIQNYDIPMEDNDYFVLNDGSHTYDIVEMSAGEQGVFPILYEFIRQQISNSIVLIDEVDLNLHPPAAQSFVSQLPKISPSCQFIITTHSESVNNIIGEDETYRLAGGSPCL